MRETVDKRKLLAAIRGYAIGPNVEPCRATTHFNRLLDRIDNGEFDAESIIPCNGCHPKPCSGCKFEKERCKYRPFAKGEHHCRYFTDAEPDLTPVEIASEVERQIKLIPGYGTTFTIDGKIIVEIKEPDLLAALEKRVEEAIRDLEKRTTVLERRHNDEDMSHRAEDFAKARAYEIAKAEGWI
jgi:hypothetical protein